MIPSVALPVSLIATFGGMAALGYSLDNLSLMALTIAAGFVVDDAIVMIENIARYVEAGETPLVAALKGARQIGFTVVSLTVSLIAVFIPLLLMGGVVGRLFREFAITLSLAVLISGVVSLTLTPMMCAQFLHRDPPGHRPNALFRWSERVFDATCEAYLRSLDRVLRHRPATLVCTALTLVATIWLYIVIPKGFLPQQDTGMLVGVTDAAADISFAAMAERQRALADAIARDPAVRNVDSFVGAGTVNPTLSRGRLYIDIGSPEQSPRLDRDRHAATARRGRRISRHHAAPSAGAGRDDRDACLADPVPVRVAGHRSAGAADLDPATAGCAAARSDVRRRGQRPAGRRPANGDQCRSRRRGPLRRDDERDRQHALRRIRAAADRHGVFAADAIPRGAGGIALGPHRRFRYSTGSTSPRRTRSPPARTTRRAA